MSGSHQARGESSRFIYVFTLVCVRVYKCIYPYRPMQLVISHPSFCGSAVFLFPIHQMSHPTPVMDPMLQLHSTSPLQRHQHSPLEVRPSKWLHSLQPTQCSHRGEKTRPLSSHTWRRVAANRSLGVPWRH